ncbi:tetratricopeptide repeat protein [Sphingobacterium sp. DK4209]|uniref:Tetratricopeptide repeat protein n=1 Tax=Sphingobacterium zhuxiongii TaxID=2662364 RepID=A0A5Q0QED3_9SPHI|nr:MULTISPECIES: ATP-binding protein [unclassified Sphingobacterium]MVZ65705.1 tetratricopeptide repeat protein [Sphingobacterium sp. DK4209]QGA27903.1 tetratricopeptide repeat protein [Sphingobacterium sp. dk4302]
MLKYYYLFAFFLCTSQTLVGQHLVPLDENKYVESLHTHIKTSQVDSAKSRSFLRLAEFWSVSDSTKAATAVEEGRHSSRRFSLPDGEIDYYLGLIELYHGEKSKAKSLFDQAINLLEGSSPNSEVRMKAIYQKAYLDIDDKGYQEMVKALTEYCIPISEKTKNLEALAYYYTQLGLTFMSVGQFDKAQQYHDKALVELEKLPEKSTVHLITYLNLVSNYCYKPDSKSAQNALENAAQLINPYPTSQHYPNFYYQQAMLHTTRQDYPKAIGSLEKGIEMARAKGQQKILQMLYFRMYNVFLMQKDYPKARWQLEQILNDNILVKEPINRKTTFTQLALVNQAMGDYKQAFQWLTKSSNLSDSLQQQKLIEKMNELEVLLQTAQKEKTIDELKAEKQEHQLQVNNRNLRISLLAIALGLSIAIGLLIFTTYRKQKKINQQTQEVHHQERIRLEKERRLDAAEAIIKGEEQERQRIAQDLHDSMGGMLANIRMSISASAHTPTKEIVEKIDKSIVEMRRISRNLMPETLKNLGLDVALEELAESMSRPDFNIQFESYNLNEGIPFKIQLAFYRIAQEALSNVIKYAQASMVIIQVSQDENRLDLTIEDDGVGFDLSEVSYGQGIANMENRAKLINAKFELSSEKGAGTTINVEAYGF